MVGCLIAMFVMAGCDPSSREYCEAKHAMWMKAYSETQKDLAESFEKSYVEGCTKGMENAQRTPPAERKCRFACYREHGRSVPSAPADAEKKLLAWDACDRVCLGGAPGPVPAK
jgi:hypothetical protein